MSDIHAEAQARTVATDALVRGQFGSPLRYVAAHESGFAGAVKVRAHERRRLGRRMYLAYNWQTRQGTTFRRRRLSQRDKARGPIFVRAHDRKVNIRAKHFFRDTVTERTKASQDRVIHALRILSRTGVIPTFGQLGA